MRLELSKKFFLILFLVTAKSFAYVALPTASEYANGERYFDDCISNNGDSNASVCETAARQAFPRDFEGVEPIVTNDVPHEEQDQVQAPVEEASPSEDYAFDS